MVHGNQLDLSSDAPNIDEVKIRSFLEPDLEECRQLFIEGLQKYVNDVIFTVFSRVLRYFVAVTMFAIAAAVMWSVWIFVLDVFLCATVSVMLHSLIKRSFAPLFNNWLETDMKDINKSYMSTDGSHMWVAELRGKVVGMVGLVQNEGHKPGVAELQRMYVPSAFKRMGIATKLFKELIEYAKEVKVKEIILTTTSIQTPAITLYKKHGFKLTAVKPVNTLLHMFKVNLWCFTLQLH